ncbi:MAG TPA: zinc-binding dehydrogenase [Actinomycetota bacterium]|nr:zinc-binding dehydrogenase [Actinomycetota bacterium]
MGYMVRVLAPRIVELAEYEDPPLAPHEVRLQTLFSGISAGTELAAYRGTHPQLSKRWDTAQRLFTEERPALRYPIEGWGYEEVGTVVEVGSEVDQVAMGDVIWGSWGHRSTSVMTGTAAAGRVLPRDVDPMLGIFSHIGAVALNAVLDADIHLGEDVAVFGQGVPGLIVTQLACLSGATVIAVDRMATRLATARAVGASHTIDATRQRAGEQVKQLTGGRGADVSVEITGSYRALHEAIRATAYNARVVTAGFFQGEASGLALGEEFHHNRIQLVCSQVAGVDPRYAGRWDRYRLQRTVLRLAGRRQLDLGALVSHVISVEDAASAFAILDRHQDRALQVVLKF